MDHPITPYAVISDILRREGGYVDHPADRGGPTNLGITQATLAAWRRRPVSAQDVEALTPAEARMIYEDRYIRRPGFMSLPHPGLIALLVDCAVHSGAQRAVTWLQRALGVRDDGIIGPITRGAVERHPDPDRLTQAVLGQRIATLGRFLAAAPDQRVFAAGWMARCSEFADDPAMAAPLRQVGRDITDGRIAPARAPDALAPLVAHLLEG